MQLITLQNFNIQTCFSQFLWFFSLKFLFKGQIISRIHLILPNGYKLMCFDRNINANRDVKFLECDYLLVQRSVNFTLLNRVNVSLWKHSWMIRKLSYPVVGILSHAPVYTTPPPPSPPPKCAKGSRKFVETMDGRVPRKLESSPTPTCTAQIARV